MDKIKEPTETVENEKPKEVIVIGLDLLLTGIDRIHKSIILLQRILDKTYTLFYEEIKRDNE